MESAPQQASLDPTLASPVDPAFQEPEYVVNGDNSLGLNVWAPENADGTLPVMVWLHGGGWTTGSGSCAIYDGENLASRGDVIVVTINHRLGASGLVDLSRVVGGKYANSSNLAIQDIEAALHWVKDNISEFGGNPDLVTIFGESGGGWKVNTMLVTPLAKGLFQRAIVESGPLTRFLTADEADELALKFLDALNIDPKNPEALDNLTWEEVIKAEEEAMADQSMASMMSAPGFPTGFWPVIDGDIIPGHVFDTYPALSSVDVPLMIGTNGTEFSLFMLGDTGSFDLSNFGLRIRGAAVFGLGNSSKVLESYRAEFPDYTPSQIWYRSMSDFMMSTLTASIMDVRTIPGAAPVYAFRFDWTTPVDSRLYAPHTIEIPFVFDNATTEAGIIMTGGGEDVAKLAKQTSDAWVSFAKRGKPSAEGLPEWPVYTTENRESMHFDNQSYIAPFMQNEVVDIFHERLWDMAGLN